jgi:hypothetical protein
MILRKVCLATIFTSLMLTFGFIFVLFPNLISWLSDDTDVISLSPPQALQQLKSHCENCTNLKVEQMENESMEFIPYLYDDLNLLLSSAFYDLRPLQVNKTAQLRIVGLSLIYPETPKIRAKLLCQLKDIRNQTYISSSLSVIFNGDVHGSTWTAFVISCPVPSKIEGPTSVRLIPKIKESRESFLKSKWLTVVHMPQHISQSLLTSQKLPEDHYDSQFQDKFSVCLSPIHVGASPQASAKLVNRFTEWMEFYRIQGVSKVYVYDFMMSPRFSKVIQAYVEEGRVQVIRYPLPECHDLRRANLSTGNVNCRKPYKYVWYHGQGTMMFDCLFRNMGRSRWMAFIDLDEFIVPRIDSNLLTYFERIMDDTNSRPSTFSGMQFGNHFSFACSIPKSSYRGDASMLKNEADTDKHIVTLHQVREADATWSFGRRSKNIINPLLVEFIGVHAVKNSFFLGQPGNFTRRNDITKKFFAKRTKSPFTVVVQAKCNCDDHFYYVHPEEATMFHFKGPDNLMFENSAYCQKLVKTSGFIKDPIIWDTLGIQLVNATKIRHQKMAIISPSLVNGQKTERLQ